MVRHEDLAGFLEVIVKTRALSQRGLIFSTSIITAELLEEVNASEKGFNNSSRDKSVYD